MEFPVMLGKSFPARSRISRLKIAHSIRSQSFKENKAWYLWNAGLDEPKSDYEIRQIRNTVSKRWE